MYLRTLVNTVNEAIYSQIGNTARTVVRLNAYPLIGVAINGSINTTLFDVIKREDFDPAAIELVKDLI